MAQVRYIVANVDQAVEFYTSHLGFKLEQQFGPAMAIVSLGDLRLWLAGPAASASKPMPDGAKPQPGGWNRFVVTVPDIEALVATMRGRGVNFRNDVVAGGVHLRVLRPARGGSRSARDEDRGRRLA